MAKAGDKGVKVKEVIVVSYEQHRDHLPAVDPGSDGREPIPMPPFVYVKPKPADAPLSLPG